MKVPKKISAFGRTFYIEKDGVLTDRMGCWGFYDLMCDTVFLKPRGEEFTEGREAQTLMHEFFHLVDENLSIGLTENQVQALAAGFLGVVRDNKLDFLSVD